MSARISENFKLAEFAVSQSHPDLVRPVPAVYRPNVEKLVNTVLQPARTGWKHPFNIYSGYRHPSLNTAVGGSPTSQHVRGEAADVGTKNVALYFRWLMRQGLPLGQCILYPSRRFVHHALPSTRFPTASFQVHEPSKGWIYKPVSYPDALDRLIGAPPAPTHTHTPTPTRTLASRLRRIFG